MNKPVTPRTDELTRTWDYTAKTVPLKGLQGYLGNRPNTHITQQSLNRGRIGDGSVIDNSKGYLSIKHQVNRT